MCHFIMINKKGRTIQYLLKSLHCITLVSLIFFSEVHGENYQDKSNAKQQPRFWIYVGRRNREKAASYSVQGVPG